MVLEDRSWRQGTVVGLIAYASVALFYGVFDLLAARGSLFTVNLLGRAMFRGLRDPTVLQYPVTLAPMAIFWYNALHFAIALIIGQIVVQLVAQAERRPKQARVAVLIIVAGFFATVVGIAWLTRTMRPLLPSWSIVMANGLAVLLAGGYLLRKRPGLWHRLMAPPDRPRLTA